MAAGGIFINSFRTDNVQRKVERGERVWLGCVSVLHSATWQLTGGGNDECYKNCGILTRCLFLFGTIRECGVASWISVHVSRVALDTVNESLLGPAVQNSGCFHTFINCVYLFICRQVCRLCTGKKHAINNEGWWLAAVNFEQPSRPYVRRAGPRFPESVNARTIKCREELPNSRSLAVRTFRKPHGMLLIVLALRRFDSDRCAPCRRKTRSTIGVPTRFYKFGMPERFAFRVW